MGENGSGKTTFVKLLGGLYPVQQGEILLNNQPIQNINPERYKALFSVVFQDFAVFSLPLGENVAASKIYDEDDARARLDEVGFVPEYPLETYLYKDLDPDGIEISGGEAQKIAIARALYRDAEFFIFDKPTASLDPRAEDQLFSKYKAMVEGRTAIFIAHRMSSCRFSDRIIVFDQVKIVQEGSHEELVAVEGKYREMWEAQAKCFT